MKCIYCEEEFDDLSDEHIIQNAIGGLLTSKKICCKECNNVLVSKNIDVPFTNIFSPMSSILNLNKSHNKKSKPSYKAIAIYEGKEYEVICRDKKIIDCPELKKELKGKFKESILEKMQVKEIKFNPSNNSFKNGFRKIAINYAIDCGVDINDIEGIAREKEDGKVTNVSLSQLVIPFIPITILDNAIEKYKEESLYHSLCLFNSKNKLWCYVELFSTFKFYVLLNDNYKGKDVNESYCQLVEKQDRTIPEFHIRSPKDALIIAQMYNVNPTCNEEELKQRVRGAILSKSNKEDYYARMNTLVEKVCLNPLYVVAQAKSMVFDTTKEKVLKDYKNEFDYYLQINEDDDYQLNTTRYRQSFFGESYPEIIMRLLTKDNKASEPYMLYKFEDISRYIFKDSSETKKR